MKVNIAAFQLSTLPFDRSKLDYYLTAAKSKGCKVAVLGEYVLNLFFKELEKTGLNLIKDQTAHQTATLRHLSKVYQLTIIAPAVTVRKGRPYKSILRCVKGTVHTYDQQVLMPYKHWNEARFFANPSDIPLSPPPVFTVDGIKFAYMGGFELHFDYFWEEVAKKRVDAVILPTASTFDSRHRWRELVKSRAVLNHCYVLRTNRIGEYEAKELHWHFYGESFLANPFGEVEESLGDREELLIATIDRETVKEARRTWAFQGLVSGREPR